MPTREEICGTADEICFELTKEISRAMCFDDAIWAGRALEKVRMFENIELQKFPRDKAKWVK